MSAILSTALPEPEVDLCFLDGEEPEENLEEIQELLRKIDQEETESKDNG